MKDEIVTVSSGNIKKYDYISATEVNGTHFVTVKATVSVGKLISYTKAHGGETELAGATFAMNIKMEKLYAENENKAMNNLVKQIESMIPYAFDYSLSTDEPVQSGNGAVVNCRVSATATSMAADIFDYFWKTMRDLLANNQSKGEFGGPLISVKRIDKSGSFKNDYLPTAKLEANSPKSSFSYNPTVDTYTIRFFTRELYGTKMKSLDEMFRRAYSSFVVNDGLSERIEKKGLSNFRLSFPAKYGAVPSRDTGSIGAYRGGTGSGYFIPVLLFRMKENEEVAIASFSIHYTLEEISKVAKIAVSPKGSPVKEESVQSADLF